MLWSNFPLLFVSWYDTIHYPVLMCDPNGFIAVKIGVYLRSCKPLDLGLNPFPIVLNLDGGQDVTPILMSY